MSHLIFEHQDIPGTDQLTEYILKDQNPFEESQIYVVNEKEKVINPEQRQSVFKLIKEKEGFELVEKLLEEINKNHSDINFKLVKNDLTHIKYQKGGFFIPHQDYLSLVSNIVQEYTMILCLKAECQGGETCFHINEFFKYKSKNSITKGGIVIFRKDLVHEGCLIEEGYKEILTVNLYGYSMTSGQIVIIKPKNNKYSTCFDKSSLDKIPNNTISSFINFSKLDNHKVILYETLEDLDQKQLDMIKNIFTGLPVAYLDFIENQKTLDYFGIEQKHVLVNENVVYNEALTHFLERDIIIFRDCNEKIKFNNEHIIKNKENYITFTLYISEGLFLCGNESCKSPPQISTAFFGDNNMIWKLLTIPGKLGDVDWDHENREYFETVDDRKVEDNYQENNKNNGDENENYDDEDEDEEYLIVRPINLEKKISGTPLKDQIASRLVPNDMKKVFCFDKMISLKFSTENWENFDDFRLEYCYLNDSYDFVGHTQKKNIIYDDPYLHFASPEIMFKTNPEYLKLLEDHSQNYLYDDENNILILKEPEKLLKQLMNSKFHKYIIDNLTKMKIDFPQQNDSSSGFACNENIYNELTMMRVDGAIKLDF